MSEPKLVGLKIPGVKEPEPRFQTFEEWSKDWPDDVTWDVPGVLDTSGIGWEHEP